MFQQHVLWAAIRLYVRVPRLSLLLFSGELRVCPLPTARCPNPTPCALLRCRPLSCLSCDSGITMGSLQSGILGFGIFKALQGVGVAAFAGFTVAENVRA